jgi:FkbM family methyltransferase
VITLPDELEWQPGALGRARALARRAILGILGGRGEDLLHAAYHRILRLGGRFGLPEDAMTQAVLSAVAQRSMTIIDVGANVGRYAWFLRRHAPTEARLYALEPHPGVAALLRRTLANLAGCSILGLGASERNGTAELVVPRGAFGSPVPGLAWVRDPDADHHGEGIQIQLRRLDSLIDDGTIAVRDPLFLKIDVEGGEVGVLRGATDLVRRHLPVIYLECQSASLARQGETPETVWAELGRAGYRLFGVSGGRFTAMPDADPGIVNYLAIPDLDDTIADGPLDAAAATRIIDAWADHRVRT